MYLLEPVGFSYIVYRGFRPDFKGETTVGGLMRKTWAGWFMGRRLPPLRGRLVAGLWAVISFWCLGAGRGAWGEEAPTQGAYHTPLAGEPGERMFGGKLYAIPAVDRAHMTALTVGGSWLEPEHGDLRGFPFGALYVRRVWEDARTRDVVSVLVNEMEYDKTLGALELVTHFENYTLPFDQREVVDNVEVIPTSLQWGTLIGSVGPGLRFPVHPFQVDNDVRVQLLGRAGYFYADRSNDTSSGVVVPPDTVLYGVKFRARYDGMRRNLLELPHRGMAAGVDVDYLHRDKWRDLSGASSEARRNYLQGAAYLVGAGGIPGLSERDRVIFCLYGGKTSEGDADRFNAFRINGAPFPGEGDDLAHPRYTGVIHNDVLSSSYATGSLGYRRELTFFLYMSLVGSYIWGERATVQGGDQVVFRQQRRGGATLAFDSGFLWNSSLYLAFSWDSGYLRNGKDGGGVTFNWNKLF